MSEDTFTLTDTDNGKLEKFLLVLPENDFISNFLGGLGTDAGYPAEYNLRIEKVLNLSTGAFSGFDNIYINEKYITFNKALEEFYSFLLTHFSIDTRILNIKYVRLYPEWRPVNDYEDGKKWQIKYEELCALMDDLERKYIDLLVTAKKELGSNKIKSENKVKLSNHKISFDDEVSTLKIGDFCSVNFPSHKNAHYLLRKTFSVRKNEVVDWEEIYEETQGMKTTTTDKKEIEKHKKSIKDTVLAINKRVKEVAKTDSKLLAWEINCVKRLY